MSLNNPQGDDAPLTRRSAATRRRRPTAQLPDGKGDTIVARTVTINRPVGEVFAYFRDFANLPTFMENVVRIDVLDDTRSHWVVKAPAGKTVEWDARVTEESADRFDRLDQRGRRRRRQQRPGRVPRRRRARHGRHRDDRLRSARRRRSASSSPSCSSANPRSRRAATCAASSS